MNKSRGSGRPACEEAAADAGYASGTWRRAASLSGQAGAGGRTDVELLICANIESRQTGTQRTTAHFMPLSAGQFPKAL